ncbi:MAG: hypothetical protein Q9168_008193, partial [Polycauliona sp. 1 TL-2023]
MALKPWLLATPATRGIGLQLARRLLNTTDLPVVATARKDLEGAKTQILHGLDVDPSRLSVLKLDVTDEADNPKDESTISAATSHLRTLFPLSSHYLHLAFCTPGILHPEKSPAQINYDSALETLKVNTLGPMMLIKHFSPFLPRKSSSLLASSSSSTTITNTLPPQSTFALMSARVGSISDNNSLGGWYSYRASKAAVNQIVKTFDLHLKQTSGEKAMCVGLHPGTVKTGLSEEFWANVKKEKLFEA